MKFNQKEFEDSVNKIDTGVKTYITDLKQKSSEEILNGSVEEAQSLISRIIPVETLYNSLSKTQSELLKLIHNQMNNNGAGHSEVEDEKKESGSDDKKEPQPEDEVKEEPKDKPQKSDDQLSDQKAYRIPILKGLIYLGGSAEVPDILDFVKRDMKNKFTDKDSDLIRNDEKEWIKIVEAEKEIMKNEGLLSSASENNSWEILQKGTDYLSKYGK